MLESTYDYSSFSISRFRRGVSKVWKYRQLLPLGRPAVTLEEGGTPLHRCRRLFPANHVLIKDESRNPTSSFADRGSTVAVSAALRLKARRVACATDGDTGASIAAYASKGGLDCTVFAPTSAEAGKLLQTLVYGAKVIRTRGSFGNSILRCNSACETSECQNLTIETNPYALEGEKTAGFEIADQLGWKSPDFVVVPVGTGSNLYSIWKGYKELRQAGVISDIPKMVAVQAKACAPVVRAYRDGREIKALGAASSIAASIAIGDPVNGRAALKALRESKGLAYPIGDEKIVEAVGLLGSKEGIFAEPASAATVCAVETLISDGTADKSDVIVCIITGSGLKVPDSIARTLKPRLAASWDLVSMGQETLGPLGRTKIQILEILENSPGYGYSIWYQLDIRFSESMSLQAIYQHLGELQKMGLVEAGGKGKSAHKGHRRKYFVLSPKGRRILSSLDTIRGSLIPMAKNPRDGGK